MSGSEGTQSLGHPLCTCRATHAQTCGSFDGVFCGVFPESRHVTARNVHSMPPWMRRETSGRKRKSYFGQAPLIFACVEVVGPATWRIAFWIPFIKSTERVPCKKITNYSTPEGFLSRKELDGLSSERDQGTVGGKKLQGFLNHQAT